MQQVTSTSNNFVAFFFLVSSLFCIAFNDDLCIDQHGSLGLFSALIVMASRYGLLPVGYGASELSIQKARDAFVPYLINYIPDHAKPIVSVPKRDIGILMLSCLENQKHHMRHMQYEQNNNVGFNEINRPHFFFIEDDCGPQQIADWMLKYKLIF